MEANDEVHRLLTANLAINGLSRRTELVAPGIAVGAKDGAGWLLRNRPRPSQSVVRANISEERREAAERVLRDKSRVEREVGLYYKKHQALSEGAKRFIGICQRAFSSVEGFSGAESLQLPREIQPG